MVNSNKKIAFIGFIGENYGDFLNELHNKFKVVNIDFEVLSYGQHEKALSFDTEYNFKIYDIGYLPNPKDLIASPELLVSILQADFYILWNGYHDVYAQIRAYLEKLKIPYLLSEYTSIDMLYHFDIGLHGERSIDDTLGSFTKNFDLTKLDKYVKPRYSSTHDNLNSELVLQIEKLKSEYKVLLYLGIWDKAAGLNSYNSKERKKKIFPHYQSTFDALQELIKSVDSSSALVIKLHPNDDVSDVAKIKDLIKGQRNIIFVENSIAVEDLIRLSDVTVTMTSTLSVVATYYAIPLVLLGNTYLSDSGYAYELKDKNGLKDLLKKACSKSNWDKKMKYRENFFNDFIVVNQTYTINDELIEMGAKSIEALFDIIGKFKKINYDRTWKDIENLFSLLGKECYLVKNIEQIEQLNKNILGKDESLQNQTKMIDEKDEVIATQTKMIDERDEIIVTQTKMIDERDYYIVEIEKKYNELIKNRFNILKRF